MRQLEMKFAGGGIVHHLGTQNYKGGAVPALAELIANAWDADANEVRVSIPLGRAIRPTDTIVVKDMGCGMNWSECNEKYLVIARDRRVVENTDKSSGGRPLMAHKGLGKLAGFGIAKVVEIRTVKNRKLTHFVMDHEKIDALNSGEHYQPDMIADEIETELDNGTEIILKNLTLEKTINKEEFFASMLVRFAIFSDEFKVYINNELLKKLRVPTEFRFPEEVKDDVKEIVDGWGVTSLPPGDIKWWIGFTEKPIQMKVMQGVSVITRGKLSQEPWDFDLSGGTYGQVGLQYLTGEILADFIDEGIVKTGDKIITNRSSVVWDDPKVKPLYDWAKNKIKTLLREWAERSAAKKVEKVEKENPELVKKIENFQPRERKELRAAMNKLAEVPTIEPEKLTTLFNYVIEGYKDSTFVKMLEEIKQLAPEEEVKILEILKEFDVSEAVRVYRIVSSHVQVIRTFRNMIESGVPEKPDMHDYIRKYPWLLGLRYQPMDYEPSLQRVLEERFKVKVDDKGGRKKPDFVCMRSSEDVLVVEVKRPGESVGLREVNQIAGYVDYLRHWVKSSNDSTLGIRIDPKNIRGFLVAYDIVNDPAVEAQIDRCKNDDIFTCKWDAILMSAEQDYRQYLQIVKSRAPSEDPRIAEINQKGIV